RWSASGPPTSSWPSARPTTTSTPPPTTRSGPCWRRWPQSPSNLHIVPERPPTPVPYSRYERRLRTRPMDGVPMGAAGEDEGRAVARVVVIEDEEPSAAAVAARLRSEGFDVDVAADGPSGVAVVERVR